MRASKIKMHAEGMPATDAGIHGEKYITQIILQFIKVYGNRLTGTSVAWTEKIKSADTVRVKVVKKMSP